MNLAMSANDPKQTSRDNDAALATGFSEDHWTLTASKLKENAEKIVLTPQLPSSAPHDAPGLTHSPTSEVWGLIICETS